tara:strand:+ start:239 stop:1669 length:1431 start_codon:yes stop_codon:yes gene_type:complete
MYKTINKTKIVATIGPVTSSLENLTELIKNGVNVCRLNFSHGSHADHQKVIDNVHIINEKLNANTGLLADLQGPKLRVGEVLNNGVNLKDGNKVNFTTNKCISDEANLYINYDDFAKDVNPGEHILVDDGKLMFEVLETNRVDNVVARVIHGGVLSSKKGVNLPNTKVSLPCLTEKDLIDLEFILTQDVSWIALSFVRNKADIIELRKHIEKSGKDIRIIAKIEKPEAIENIDDILEVTDGCMVARGDLGVEIPMQDVPLIQKDIIKRCRKLSKPVIIATQMMESMITNVSPTRAEVNDVANAVLDGADAVMLSGETSVGKFPNEVIKAMHKIIIRVEETPSIYYKKVLTESESSHRLISNIVCESASKMAKQGDAKAIVTMSFSGYTGFKISSYRPKSNIYVFTANKYILNMLSLVWGVRGLFYDKFVSTDHTIDDIKFILKQKDFLKEGDLIINVASMPIASKGMSNMLRMSYA